MIDDLSPMPGMGTSVPMHAPDGLATVSPMNGIRRSGGRGRRCHKGKYRFEHWYRDNQVYFITARCRDRFPALLSEEAKAVFWERFDALTGEHRFVPWVTSLLDNHYHTLGYLKIGEALPTLMQRLHGSVAKLVNDLLERRTDASAARRTSFWHESRTKTYFDDCIRDVKQARCAYRYVLTQAVRHGEVQDYTLYPHTHVNVECERAIRRVLELDAFLRGVPYRRYQDRAGRGD